MFAAKTRIMTNSKEHAECGNHLNPFRGSGHWKHLFKPPSTKITCCFCSPCIGTLQAANAASLSHMMGGGIRMEQWATLEAAALLLVL